MFAPVGARTCFASLFRLLFKSFRTSRSMATSLSTEPQLTVAISIAPHQRSPTNGDIRFILQFSRLVAGFALSDVSPMQTTSTGAAHSYISFAFDLNASSAVRSRQCCVRIVGVICNTIPDAMENLRCALLLLHACIAFVQHSLVSHLTRMKLQGVFRSPALRY